MYTFYLYRILYEDKDLRWIYPKKNGKKNLETYWNLKWMKLVMLRTKMAVRSDERNVIIGDQI